MKKLLCIALLLSLSTGCGRGWLPCLFRGAPCHGTSCLSAAPALPESCVNCSTSAGYAPYDGEIVSDGVIDNGYYGSGVINQGFTNPPLAAPPMSNLPSAAGQ